MFKIWLQNAKKAKAYYLYAYQLKYVLIYTNSFMEIVMVQLFILVFYISINLMITTSY